MWERGIPDEPNTRLRSVLQWATVLLCMNRSEAMGRAVTRELEGKVATGLQSCPQKEPEPLREMVRQNPGAAFLRLKYKLMQKTKLRLLHASQVALVVKNPPVKAQKRTDKISIPGSRRSPRRGHGNPQYSCLENPMDRGAWRATVHGNAESWT